MVRILLIILLGASCTSDAWETPPTEESPSQPILVEPTVTQNEETVGRVFTQKVTGPTLCTATLIAKDVIVTAGHCIDEIVSTSGHFVVESYTVTAELLVKDMSYDIAFFRVASAFAKHETMESSINTEDYQGEPIQMEGWGCATADGSETAYVKQGVLDIITSTHGNGHYIVAKTGFKVCPGDSGSAIISIDRGVVIGVLSGSGRAWGGEVDFANMNVLARDTTYLTEISK